jgi:hypothetical protein
MQHKMIRMSAKVKDLKFLHANCTIVRYDETDHERLVSNISLPDNRVHLSDLHDATSLCCVAKYQSETN